MEPLREGQEVYYVQYRGEAKLITVLKVGRKWASLSNMHRADKYTWAIDGGGYSNRGSLWPDEQAYTNHVEVNKAYRVLGKDVGHYPRVGVTVDDIPSARQLLRLDDGEEG